MFREMKWKIRVSILAAVIVLGLVYYYGIIHNMPEAVRPNYSVILYQNTDNEWATLMEGVKQAEEDLEVNVNYITMSANDRALDQFEMIGREVKSGVSGILLAAADSEAVGELLDEADFSVPVVCVETGVGDLFSVISADDYEMGKALGEKIISDMDADRVYGRERKVTVIAEYLERESVRERYEGLKAVMEAASPSVQIEEQKRSEGDYSLQLFVKTVMNDSSRYIAALDKFSTGEAASAWASWKADHDELDTQYKIYGIGNTAQTVNDLDNENIRALVYQNEFNMGYQGLSVLVTGKSEKWISENVSIMYKMVTKETLYEHENERWLFPNV